MTTYKVLGVVSAERACECCGNRNLERNVVLQKESGELLYVGSDCAGKLVHGKKSASNGKAVLKVANVMQKAAEFLAAGHARTKVAEYVWNHTGLSELRLQVLAG